jgi:putative ABC transport system permease protein
MLKPLPYTAPDRLVQIWSLDQDGHRNKDLLSSEDLDRLQTASQSFQDIGYYRPWMTNLSAPGPAERISTALVSPGFLTALRVAPAMGRPFNAGDMTPGKNRVVIVSGAFWHRRLHTDPAIIGKTVTVDGFPCTVVGVLPSTTRLIAPSIDVQPDLIQPISVIMGIHLRPESAFAFGRLRPGIWLESARAEMETLARQLPGKLGTRRIHLVPMAEEIASEIRPALLILFAAAVCVLLIACGNIASLILAATSAREAELALRTALGATRGRLARQLLTESIALSVLGTALGLLLSLWAVRTIVHLYPERIPRLESLRPEPAVFAFAALLALLTALLFGGWPAWRYSRADLHQVLKARSRSRDLLLAVQIAAALILLTGAGLLLRSFLLMRAIDPGYQRHNLLVAHLMLDDKTYAEPARQAAFVERLLQRMDTLPGVEAAGATNSLPLDFNFLMSVTVGIEGHPELSDRTEVDCRSVTPHFLETMGIGLATGRYLQPADSAVSGGVMVNQAFAKRYFDKANPLGRHLYLGKEPRAIVGVVADIRDLQLSRKAQATIYVPFDRQPTPFVDLALRTTAEPRFLLNAVRAELRAIDPNQPLGKVSTMEDVLSDAVAKPRWYAILIGCFASLALLLAAVGIYGVVAYAVSRRTHEIGIRMAIGAQTRDVLRMVLLRAMAPPLVGVAIGLPLAAAVCKVLASFLYEVKPLDVGTYCVVALLVPVVSLMAAYLPARRATEIDPIAALRRQ